MSGTFNSERKFKSDDIVNGAARIDIFDSKGELLVKKGSRLREVHYQRMFEEGLIEEEDNGLNNTSHQQGIHYSAPHTIHSRLNWLISTFSTLQQSIITQPDAELYEDLKYISEFLEKLCDENIYQVLGELYLSDVRGYRFIKPLYIAASLNELIRRYNQYHPEQPIKREKKLHLLQAALLHNLGLLIGQQNVYNSHKKLSPEQRKKIRQNYPQASVQLAEKIGISETDILEAIRQHNIESKQPLFEAQLLRMPFIYAGIAMREPMNRMSMDIINPTREFARLFSEDKLDPILGGLFLKINGLAPVGAILIFDSREKALIISGPNESNIASSKMRLISNTGGVQLKQPGDKFHLHSTELVQKGLSDHHQFAWNKFSPFAAWEK